MKSRSSDAFLLSPRIRKPTSRPLAIRLGVSIGAFVLLILGIELGLAHLEWTLSRILSRIKRLIERRAEHGGDGRPAEATDLLVHLANASVRGVGFRALQAKQRLSSLGLQMTGA